MTSKVSITCERCGHTIKHEYDRLEASEVLTCPKCGYRFNLADRVVSELGKGLDLAARAIAAKLKGKR